MSNSHPSVVVPSSYRIVSSVGRVLFRLRFATESISRLLALRVLHLRPRSWLLKLVEGALHAARNDQSFRIKIFKRKGCPGLAYSARTKGQGAVPKFKPSYCMMAGGMQLSSRTTSKGS